ncbi:hypothetical protein G3N59_05405 [Paraburkholderia sp. Ac-20340]|uniref:hypothetical protein n=1 Tax=Paraburkholderia sp. Ac-20340 TaxID=2703888 RepID=UPI00197FDCB4|nr:hypothetical protein [Paraburkholderia sp. Ac-20340]MBN3852812.1 hypothetical protein [Paraburkholderia sp. Ac-20340]
MLTRDQILAAQDRESEVINVQEWGGEVRVAVLSGAGREKVQAAAGKLSTVQFGALLLALTLIDEAGAPLFGEDDIAALANKNVDVISRVLDVAIRVNKLTVSDVEEAEKNSEAAPKDSSGSISQKN